MRRVRGMMRNSRDRNFKRIIKISAVLVFILTVLPAVFSLSRGVMNPSILFSPVIPIFLLLTKFPRSKMPKYLVVSCFLSLFTALLFCGHGNSLNSLKAISLSFITSLLFHLSMVFPEEKPFYSKSGFLFVRIFYLLSFVFSSFFFFVSAFLGGSFEAVLLKGLYILALSASVFLVLATSRFVSKKCSVTHKRKSEHFVMGAFLSVFLWVVFVLFAPDKKPLYSVLFALFFLLEDLIPNLKNVPSRKLVVFLLSILVSSASFFLISIMPASFLNLGKWKIFVMGMLGSLFLAWSFKYSFSLMYMAFYGNPDKRIQNLMNFEKTISINESTVEFAKRLGETLLQSVGCEKCWVYARRKQSFACLSGSKNTSCGVFDASRKDGLVNFLESTTKPVVFEEETSPGFRNLSVEDMLQVKKEEGYWILPFFSGWEMIAFAMGTKPRKPMDKTIMDALTVFSRRVSGVLTALLKIDNLSEEIKREEKKKIREEVFESFKKGRDERVEIKKINGDDAGECAFFLFKYQDKTFCGYLKWVPDELDWLKISRLENLTYELKDNNGLNSFFEKITSLVVTQSALIVIGSKSFDAISENCESLFCLTPEGVTNYTPDLQTTAKRLFLSSTDIFELRNVKYEKIGKERIVSILSSHQHENFDDFAQKVYSEIDAWAVNASGLKDTEIMLIDLQI
ncbi:hypothetical protein JXA84_01595 [candidate division WOR-3 bacterium]|nr:hypothetical protein [candidate division WOR-3 bacterium]